MNDTTTLIDAAKQAMSLRVADDSDFMPTLVTEYEPDGEINVVLLATEGHPYDVLRTSASALVHGVLRSVSLTCDTYMYKGAEDGASYGNLGIRFNNGDPNVTEALSITVTQRKNEGGVDGATSYSINLPYVRGKDIKGTATILWGEPIETDVVDGRMVDLLQAMIVASLTYEDGD